MVDDAVLVPFDVVFCALRQTHTPLSTRHEPLRQAPNVVSLLSSDNLLEGVDGRPGLDAED